MATDRNSIIKEKFCLLIGALLFISKDQDRNFSGQWLDSISNEEFDRTLVQVSENLQDIISIKDENSAINDRMNVLKASLEKTLEEGQELKDKLSNEQELWAIRSNDIKNSFDLANTILGAVDDIDLPLDEMIQQLPELLLKINSNIVELDKIQPMTAEAQPEPMTQDQLHHKLVSMVSANPLVLHNTPEFRDAVNAQVEKEKASMPDFHESVKEEARLLFESSKQNLMSLEQAEKVISDRVQAYKKESEIKYNEFYVSVDGGTPYLVCSPSGRYLSCNFKDKPKASDWFLSKDFSMSHWFSGPSARKDAKALIKRLIKEKFKRAKKLEIRRVRLIAPDK